MTLSARIIAVVALFATLASAVAYCRKARAHDVEIGMGSYRSTSS